MKPTKSNDGNLRFNLRVTFRIGAEDFVTMIALWFNENFSGGDWLKEDGPKVYHDWNYTKKETINLLREKFAESGPFHCGSWDYINDERIREKAEKVVAKMFPELGEIL